MTIYNQSMLRNGFSKCVKIDSIDERGYYIVEAGINGGIHYLYKDGVIRASVSGSQGAFWKTEKEALDFWEAWK